MKLIDYVLPEFGLIKGRDAIEILEIIAKNPRNIEVIGSVSISAIERPPLAVMGDFVSLRFTFHEVVLYKLSKENIRGNLTDAELDMFSDSEASSSIMEIENSSLAQKNKEFHGPKQLHHIIVEAYDFNIESLCGDLIVEKI